MLKKFNCTFLLVSIFFLLFGCNQGIEKTEIEANAKDYSNFTKKYLTVLELQNESVLKGIETVSKYIDIDCSPNRSLITSYSLDDINLLLPSDLSLLKRNKEKIKNGRFVIGETEEITLREELDEIVEEFNEGLSQLIPNPSKALSLDYINGTETGILIADDVEIPFNSIEGIVTVELLNAVADGYNAQQLVNELSEAMEKDSRALFQIRTTSCWINGRINYRWGNITNEHRQAVINAMEIWTKKTDKKISFKEFSYSGWNEFQLGLCVVGCIKIYDENTDNWNGRATIGYVSGPFGYLKLRAGISGQALSRTCLHELGHVLGLKHEHQRYDRDSYIFVENSNNDYSKIEKDFFGWCWQKKQIKVWLWTITIWYPCWTSQKNSMVYGDFDFNSIMLYPDIKIKAPYNNLNNGYKFNNSIYTRYNTVLSANDIAMVKEIYQ